MSKIDEYLTEIKDDIAVMSVATRAKLNDELPKTFSIKSCSAYDDEKWLLGFKRCLAEVKRAIERAKK